MAGGLTSKRKGRRPRRQDTNSSSKNTVDSVRSRPGAEKGAKPRAASSTPLPSRPATASRADSAQDRVSRGRRGASHAARGLLIASSSLLLLVLPALPSLPRASRRRQPGRSFARVLLLELLGKKKLCPVLQPPIAAPNASLLPRLPSCRPFSASSKSSVRPLTSSYDSSIPPVPVSLTPSCGAG